MSANPARILGLRDRGRIAAGLRADLVIVDTHAQGKINPAQFKSRGKCSPFTGRELRGKIIMTLNAGKIVYMGDKIA
jgi:dihydroorotase